MRCGPEVWVSGEPDDSDDVKEEARHPASELGGEPVQRDEEGEDEKVVTTADGDVAERAGPRALAPAPVEGSSSSAIKTSSKMTESSSEQSFVAMAERWVWRSLSEI